MGNFLQQKKKCITGIKNYTYNSFNEFHLILILLLITKSNYNSASSLLQKFKFKNLIGFCSIVITILNGIGSSPGRHIFKSLTIGAAFGYRL